jgi:hypothetical protein
MLTSQSNSCLRFLQEPLDDWLTVEDVRQQELDCYQLMKIEVHRLYDDAHAASSKHALDAISAGNDCIDRDVAGHCHGAM